MAERGGFWFVYRSHYEGPLSKRVRRFDGTILDWFRELIRAARDAEEPYDLGEAALGGDVYGFGGFLERAKEERFALPRSHAALAALLRRHVFENEFASDAHTLRVLADDDEVALAYFFFDDEAERRHPDRVSYLLHDEPRLPDGGAEGGFVPPVRPKPLFPAGGGEGATYVCLLTFADGDSLPGTSAVFPGVRLPGLAHHLLRAVPRVKAGDWPDEMRLLRAMVEPGDDGIGAALDRAQTYPLLALQHQSDTDRLGLKGQPEAREEFLSAGGGLRHLGDPARSIIQEGRHVALLCLHAWDYFGYQQWVLFDDLWAAAHQELASSLLWYASHWDPFHGLKAGRRGRRQRPGPAL